MKRLFGLMFVFAVAASAAAAEPTVTLDVKDARAREILASMQKQCGIKNLIVDPDVDGSGSFFFKNVPCTQAFDAVLRTMDLTAVVDGTNLVEIGKRKR